MSGKNTPYMNFSNWHSSNHSKSDEFAWKKSIIIHDLNWCQKLPGIILVTSTNFTLKNILVKVPFWAKMMVPYESQKREKIHISYIMHPRKISLTKSRGNKSFFYCKSGVQFWFWPHLEKLLQRHLESKHWGTKFWSGNDQMRSGQGSNYLALPP